jgi:hypothetical protein
MMVNEDRERLAERSFGAVPADASLLDQVIATFAPHYEYTGRPIRTSRPSLLQRAISGLAAEPAEFGSAANDAGRVVGSRSPRKTRKDSAGQPVGMRTSRFRARARRERMLVDPQLR